MTTESNDIVQAIRAAEVEADELVQTAEDSKRRAIAETEQESARKLAELRVRVQQEHEAALSRANAEAAELLRRSATEAEAAARAVADVPKERLERAVERVVEALHRQWQ